MSDVQYLIADAIYWFGRCLNFLILVRVLLSWLPLERNNSLVRFVYTMTEPILAPIRNLIFKSPMGGSGMMLDFSPVIAVFGIQGATVLLQGVIGGL